MATRKEAIMNSIRNEVALANAQELMNVSQNSPITPDLPTDWKQKASEKCYAKCVTKPGTYLSSSEEVRNGIFASVFNLSWITVFRHVFHVAWIATWRLVSSP